MTSYEMERFGVEPGAHSYWLECMGLYETRYIMFYDYYSEPESIEDEFRSLLIR